MKSVKSILLAVIMSLLVIPINSAAQDINVTKLIGRSIDSAVKKLGKPAHQDRSNEEMECVFYKSKTHQIILVANKQGIYQAEGMKYYKTKKNARKMLNSILGEAMKSGCVVDTVNAAEYNIDKKGCEANVIMMENPGSKKFEVRIKASSREG